MDNAIFASNNKIELTMAYIKELIKRIAKYFYKKMYYAFQRKSAYYLAKAYEFGHQLAMRHFPDAMV